MPPRTGPRSKRRTKASAPRHLTIIHTSTWLPDTVIAHSVELDAGHLVLRDQNDAVSRIVAAGEWREIRPTVMADIPYPEDADRDRIDSMQREEATLTNENAPAIPTEVTRGAEPRTVEFDTVRAPIREEESRFVPSSPEEAQRILMEIERRLAPDYQDPPDDAPPTPLRKD